MTMSKSERDALDRHITGNYGEDQFTDDPSPEKLFDVTCVIGTVWKDDESGFSPYQAAMMLVAEHKADGSYTFPSEDGKTVTVTVITR